MSADIKVAAREVVNRKGMMAPWQENRLRDYIEIHLSEKISVGDLMKIAKRKGKSHFAQTFKNTFDGLAPEKYVWRRRIEEACRLMTSTEDSLIQVALACGFNYPSHFSKKFREAMGVAPFAWRLAQQDYIVEQRSARPVSVSRPPRKGFAVVALINNAPACADAPPLLHEQNPAEQIRLHVEPIEAPHVAASSMRRRSTGGVTRPASKSYSH